MDQQGYNQTSHSGFDPNQYAFITNPAPKPKKSLIPGSGSSTIQRIVIVVAGVLILITIVLLLWGLVFNNNSDKEDLTALAQTQSELIHLSATGQKLANGTDTKEFSASLDLVMTTDRQAVLDALAKNGTKLKTSKLDTTIDKSLDEQLKTADGNGDFDGAYNKLVQQLLTSYQTKIVQTYKETNSKSAKAALTTANDNASLLLAQLQTSN